MSQLGPYSLLEEYGKVGGLLLGKVYYNYRVFKKPLKLFWLQEPKHRRSIIYSFAILQTFFQVQILFWVIDVIFSIWK